MNVIKKSMHPELYASPARHIAAVRMNLRRRIIHKEEIIKKQQRMQHRNPNAYKRYLVKIDEHINILHGVLTVFAAIEELPKI